MRLLLNSIDYLTPAGKEKINQKLDAIRVFNLVPSWINDDEEVLKRVGTFNPNESLFANSVRLNRQRFLLSAKQLIDGPDLQDPPPTFEVNSNYQPSKKLITVFLGYNLPPFFSPDYPLPVKYGGLGALVGHELMHAFDADNIKSGFTEVQDSWLTAQELKAYDKHRACLVQQYSQYCYKKLGACLSGLSAIADNIADIGGLKASYAAYQFARQMVAEEPPLPGLEKYSGDQIFFMSFSRLYCTRNDPDANSVFLDDHTPDKARGDIALRNVLHFAEAYSCPVGSPAAPVKICRMWGDIYGPKN